MAPRLRQLLDQFVNERVERRLHIKRAAILALVRSGRIDLLDELDQLDSGLYGKGAATSVRWIAGQLHLKARVAWYSDQAAAPSLRVDDNRLVLDVSPELAHALPSRLVDVTDAVQRAEGTFAVRSRDTAASWLVPTTNRRHIETPAVEVNTLTIDAETDLDIDGAMQGHPLTDPLWDVFLNAGYLAGHQQRRLSVDPMPRAVALIKGRCAIAYRTQRGTLASHGSGLWRRRTGWRCITGTRNRRATGPRLADPCAAHAGSRAWRHDDSGRCHCGAARMHIDRFIRASPASFGRSGSGGQNLIQSPRPVPCAAPQERLG